MDIPEKLTDRRLKDGRTARDLWVKFRKDSENRRHKAAVVQNQLDGCPPFLNADLVANGQGWRCNINFRDASSTLDQVLIGYWRLLHDSPTLAAVELMGGDPKKDVWSDVFQSSFDRFVNDWGPDYVHQYLQFSQNHVGFGVGIPYFPDSRSARWENIRQGDFECPARTKTSIGSLNIFQCRSTTELEDLWRKIRTPEHRKASEARGWNVAAIDRLLATVINDLDTTHSTVDQTDIMESQRQLRNDAVGTTTGRKPIAIIHSYVKDYDDKITHTITAENSTDPVNLFDDHSKADRCQEMAYVVGPVFFDSGNGDFYGVKGFGVKNHEIAATTNRLKSRAVDRTVIDGLNFVDKRETANEVPAVVSVGPFNFLPPGVEQLSHYPNGRAIAETIAMMEAQFSENNARYRDGSQQIADSGTARQASILANMQTQVDVANATLYLFQVARNLFAEQFRRLRLKGNRDKDALLFKKRCVEEKGMPLEIFHDAEIIVRTGSDPGAANLAMRGEKALQLLSLPDANRRFAQETWVSANFGPNAVPSALRPVDSLEDKKAQGLAIIENDVMGAGNGLPVDPQQNHAAHAPLHLQPMQAMVDQFEQTGQPNPDVMVALQFMIPHVEEHMNFLSQDKLEEAIYKQAKPMFASIKASAEGMFKMAERLAAQQQPEQQLAGAIGATAPQA